MHLSPLPGPDSSIRPQRTGLRHYLRPMPPDLDQLARTVTEQGESLRAISDTVIDTKTIVEQHTRQLAAIQRTLVRHERRFDGIDGRFDEINGTLAEVLRRLPEPTT